MFAARRRRHHSFDSWPGFVDALATVLMVIIFVLMTFIVSQLYLTNALSDRDETLVQLSQQIKTLSDRIKTEQMSKEEAQKALANLTHQLTVRSDDLAAEQKEKHQAVDKVSTLSHQLAELQATLVRLEAALKGEEEKNSQQGTQMMTLQQRLDSILGEKEVLTGQVAALTQKQDLGQYRSDFLAKLVQILGGRQDIRVMGDRFVFQSEVLFDRGSADLGGAGRGQLDKLAKALKEISQKIPESIHWILRVDGHTDHVPISTAQFRSNWELSSARAISVVRYLISQGIDPANLVAAGFGEFQPLETTKDEEKIARNRRIEFRLDQR
jgi:chemotaxis protein MotB